MFLGRLEPRKGPRELLAALGKLDGSWHATIAGRGPLLEDQQAEAARLGIADRVTFPGFIADDDVPGLLADADVVALPSTGGESFGISVVEALAAASGPVLAGDNPGYRTVMTGLEENLVDPTDTGAFAVALKNALALAADPERRAALVERQRQAAQRFDVAVIGAQVEAIYRSMAAV